MATALTLATQARRVKTQDPSNIYASAFWRRRHYVFGLSVRPKPEIPSFDLYQPKPFYGMSVRPSVYINGSMVLGADESPWPCGTPSWYTPLSWMILSKQKNLHLFSSQYISVFSKMSVRQSGEVSGHLPENAWRDWPEILHAGVPSPSSELISLWPWSGDFSNFGTILT